MDPNPNPKAVQLAAEFGAQLEDVMRWFDQGYPPSEIERAYRLGKEEHAEVGDILAMLDAGMDWRMIKKALDTVPDWIEDDEDDDDSTPVRKARKPPRR